MVRQLLRPLAPTNESWGVDQERDLQALLPDSVIVLEAAVLAKAFSMVTVYHEDGVVVEPELFVLVNKILQEDVLQAHAVEVAVDQLVLREVLVPVAGAQALVVVMARAQQVFSHERLILVLP